MAEALAAEDAGVPGPGEPRLQELVQGRVLAPVGVHGPEADDGAGDGVAVLPQHLLAHALGDGVDVLPVRGAVLGEGRAGGREAGGGHGGGEEEAPDPQGLAQLQHVAEAAYVGAPVLGVVLAGEVVVGRQVDHHVHPPALEDGLEDRLQVGGLPDVHLEPAEAGPFGDAAFQGGAPGDGEDLPAVLEVLQEVPPQKPGGSGEDHARQGHFFPPLEAASPPWPDWGQYSPQARQGSTLRTTRRRS